MFKFFKKMFGFVSHTSSNTAAVAAQATECGNDLRAMRTQILDDGQLVYELAVEGWWVHAHGRHWNVYRAGQQRFTRRVFRFGGKFVLLAERWEGGPHNQWATDSVTQFSTDELEACKRFELAETEGRACPPVVVIKYAPERTEIRAFIWDDLPSFQAE